MIIKSFDMSMVMLDYLQIQPNETAKLTSCILEHELVSKTLWNKRPAVIVCAGGGYPAQGQAERRRRLCLNTALPDFMIPSRLLNRAYRLACSYMRAFKSRQDRKGYG